MAAGLHHYLLHLPVLHTILTVQLMNFGEHLTKTLFQNGEQVSRPFPPTSPKFCLMDTVDPVYLVLYVSINLFKDELAKELIMKLRFFFLDPKEF